MVARWRQFVVLPAMLGGVSVGCASRISLPEDVTDAERRAVEGELAEVTLAELERAANRRYWELFLTDPVVVARLPEPQREDLRRWPLHELVTQLDERVVGTMGFAPLEIARKSGTGRTPPLAR